jgi:uncharacterized OsmC-like protein
METSQISEALRRVVSVFQRRPASASHADSSAMATWQGGLKTLISHPNTLEFTADMPAEFGGGGLHVTPGWFMRAGAASCTATCIAMAAAQRDIELTELEVTVTSRSDARGNLGMSDETGQLVDATPSDFAMLVRISADQVSPEILNDLVGAGVRASSVIRSLETPLRVALHVECNA